MTCPACLKAETNPHCAEFWNGCVTCEVRAMSQAPRHARQAAYAAIADPEEREAFRVAVGLEFKRRESLTTKDAA